MTLEFSRVFCRKVWEPVGNSEEVDFQFLAGRVVRLESRFHVRNIILFQPLSMSSAHFFEQEQCTIHSPLRTHSAVQ